MPQIHRPDAPNAAIRDADMPPQSAGGKNSLRSFFALVFLAGLLFFGLQHTASTLHINPAQGTATRSVQPALGKPTDVQPGAFGWLAFLAKPLYFALQFLHRNGIPNWGWAIIALTALFNTLTLWPRVLSMQSSLKTMRLQPRVKAIQQRYASLKINDPKRTAMHAEMSALYKTEGVNVYGGCLPLLLQIPLFVGYASVLRHAPELHSAHWYWLTDLAAPDPLHVLPLLILSTMMLTQGLTPTPGMSPSQRWVMALLMPAVMGFSLWHYASGLSLYWITGNVMNLLFQIAMNRSDLGREIHALAAASSARKEKHRTDPGSTVSHS